MDYRIELVDPWGRRRFWYDQVDLLEVVRTAPDRPDLVRGLLPPDCEGAGPAWRVRVYFNDVLHAECEITSVSPEWSDLRKLILERYVNFHEVLAFEAETPANPGNTRVSRTYTNQSITNIVKDIINSAPGAIHYYVAHTAYPDGAQREYTKFLGRKTTENELEAGGIASGDWVAAGRMDLAGAYAKDGDTIAGIVVDGAAWPDVRLMMIDCEETARNSHAISRHPEVADWTNAQYNASGYKLRADAATAFLQSLLDTHGIDFIELNPHRNAAGEYDDRVDAYGRYIALVYGGGLCFNAAQVEQGHADVYLYEDGRYHVPEMALKDYYSYSAPHTDSVHAGGAHLAQFDASGGVLELLTALCYAAGGYVFSVGLEHGVAMYPAGTPDRTLFYDPVTIGVAFGADAGDMVNMLTVAGNPFHGEISAVYCRPDSVDRYGLRARTLPFYSISHTQDATPLANGLLADLAYPAPVGVITFFQGDAALRAGDLIELRGAPLRHQTPPLPDAYDDRYGGRLVARVHTVRHKIHGRHVTTTAELTSPLRSVTNPLSYMVRSQEAASELFAFRLDDPLVGLDMGLHLD
ncbi:MAG: thermonuclease family protein [Candidatus Hydrogenedentota bacterium]